MNRADRRKQTREDAKLWRRVTKRVAEDDPTDSVAQAAVELLGEPRGLKGITGRVGRKTTP